MPMLSLRMAAPRHESGFRQLLIDPHLMKTCVHEARVAPWLNLVSFSGQPLRPIANPLDQVADRCNNGFGVRSLQGHWCAYQ